MLVINPINNAIMPSHWPAVTATKSRKFSHEKLTFKSHKLPGINNLILYTENSEHPSNINQPNSSKASPSPISCPDATFQGFGLISVLSFRHPHLLQIIQL
jgi:hypothetical protein